MTKYVLNSGGLSKKPELAKKFFAEVLKDIGGKPRVLLCYFGQPRENWEKNFENAKRTNFFPEEKHPVLELAFPNSFEDQVKNSDALYIPGGDMHLMQYWLEKFDIPRIWEGKVVATNSASSQALSKYFWTCDWRKPMDGLGLLPIKFLAHYKSDFGNDDPRGPIDWERSYNELKEYKDATLPVHALKEGEYVSFEI